MVGGHFFTIDLDFENIFWGYSQFRKEGAILSIWAFQRNQFLHFFYIRKYPSYTHTKFISVISKCLKQATLR